MRMAVLISMVFVLIGCEHDSGGSVNASSLNNSTGDATDSGDGTGAGDGTDSDDGTDSGDGTALTRTFQMGFTPWLYDATLGARSWTYEHILTHGDIISEHMEEGVPWPEALDGLPFSESYQTEISDRIQLARGHDIVLQINPMNIRRDGLADYRGDSVTEPLPPEWQNRSFSDPEVQTAFLNYAIRMVELFRPKYLVIGVEVNLLLTNSPEKWDGWVQLNRYVYTQLKARYPDLPVGVSVFCVPYFDQWAPEHDSEAQIEALHRDIEPWTDYIAFSVHPFMSALLADYFPGDYLTQLFSLTEKPIAVSESSYPAQEWSLSNGLTFYGTPEKQDRFLSLLLNAAQDFSASYVIWFTIRDYDQLWEHVLGSSEETLIWRDTGLYDENGNERPSLSTWSGWLTRPLAGR